MVHDPVALAAHPAQPSQRLLLERLYIRQILQSFRRAFVLDQRLAINGKDGNTIGHGANPALPYLVHIYAAERVENIDSIRPNAKLQPCSGIQDIAFGDFRESQFGMQAIANPPTNTHSTPRKLSASKNSLQSLLSSIFLA
jgi:hypothetical protein